MSRNPAARDRRVVDLELQARARRAVKREHRNAVGSPELEPTQIPTVGQDRDTRVAHAQQPTSQRRRVPLVFSGAAVDLLVDDVGVACVASGLLDDGEDCPPKIMGLAVTDHRRVPVAESPDDLLPAVAGVW